MRSFSGIYCDRLDLDTVKKKGELQRKLKSFQKGRTDILIGTQLIAKGLDFRNVGLVGIISADVSLNIPDFRSPERAFQLITQAAGRAGRGEEPGRVIIQTYSPEHYAIQFAADQDYEGFFSEEIILRRYMEYPPYSDLIQIMFMAKTAEAAGEAAQDWHDRIASRIGNEIVKMCSDHRRQYMSRIKRKLQVFTADKVPEGKAQRIY